MKHGVGGWCIIRTGLREIVRKRKREKHGNRSKAVKRDILLTISKQASLLSGTSL